MEIKEITELDLYTHIGRLKLRIEKLEAVREAAEALKKDIGRTIELREEWRYDPKNTISSAASLIVDLNVLADFVEALAACEEKQDG